jgi:hypothetical protein
LQASAHHNATSSSSDCWGVVPLSRLEPLSVIQWHFGARGADNLHDVVIISVAVNGRNNGQLVQETYADKIWPLHWFS